MPFLIPPIRMTIPDEVEILTFFGPVPPETKLVAYENGGDGMPGKLVFQREIDWREKRVSLDGLTHRTRVWVGMFHEGGAMDTYVLREAADSSEANVVVKYRDGGYVYFKPVWDTSDKLDRLEEGEFQRRYAKEDELRLQES